jgi:lysophospholipase L1-like esterase
VHHSPLVRRAARLLGIVALQSLAAFALLEGVGRVFDPYGVSYYPNTAACLDTMIIEEPIGYRNRPGLRGKFYDVPVRINSLGLRGPEIPVPAKENEFRVLMLGDSVPFGVGVPVEDTYPSELERQLNEGRGPLDPTVYRTVNLGVPSYNTEQELVQLESVGMTLDPDLVTLLFTVNDIEEKMWVFDKRDSWLVKHAQRSYAAALLMRLYRDVRGAVGRPAEVVRTGDYREGHPRWESCRESLAQMNSLCRAAGVPFVVFTYQLGEGDPQRLVRGVGLEEGFPVIDLDPGNDPRWAGTDLMDYVVPNGGWHPNDEGHAICATLIRESLLEIGCLPSPLGLGPQDPTVTDTVPPSGASGRTSCNARRRPGSPSTRGRSAATSDSARVFA